MAPQTVIPDVLVGGRRSEVAGLAVALVVCLLGCDATLGKTGNIAAGGNGGAGGAAGVGGNTDQPSAGKSGAGGVAGVGGNTDQPSAGSTGAGGTVVTPTARCPGGDSPLSTDPAGNTWVCQGTIIHRAHSNACPPRVPSDTPLPSTGLGDECVRDTDCVAKSNPRCINSSGFGGSKGNTCSYGCLTDQDCGTGSDCNCSAGGGGCVAANCATDDNCATGKFCVTAKAAACGGSYLYTCQTASDECASQPGLDCPSGDDCRWSGDHFTCLTFCGVQ